jgi:hypothetical protein
MMMTRAAYDTWLRTSQLVALEDDPPSATIEVRDGYCVDWCSHRMIEPVQRTLAGVLGWKEVALTFRARDQGASA